MRQSRFPFGRFLLVFVVLMSPWARNLSAGEDHLSEAISLARNINTTTGGIPHGLAFPVALDGFLYVVKDGDESGWEIWRTDGSEAGTEVVTDVHPANGFEPVLDQVVLGGEIYFTASGDGLGRELWRTDGTPGNEELFIDMIPGSTGSDPQSLMVFDDALYFTADHEVWGRELWKTDGTPEGTTLVRDIAFETLSSNPDHFAIVREHLYFGANDGVSGEELWRSDGTEAGTELVVDLAPLELDAFPRKLTEFQGILLFSARDESLRSIWRTDGTAAGTWIVTTEETIGINLDDITPLDDLVVFNTWDAGVGHAVWASDTTPGNVSRIGTVGPPHAISSDQSLRGFTRIGDQLIFGYRDTFSIERELWRTDGTAAGTEMIAAFEFSGGPSPDYLTEFEGVLYFVAADSDLGIELWRSDGTSEGTVVAVDLRAGPLGSLPFSITVFEDEMYFTANDGISGVEIWRSNGTPEGTILVADQDKGFLSSEPTGLVASNGFVFFSADDGIHGREPWAAADSIEAGAEILADINPLVVTGGDSRSSGFIEFGEYTYFAAFDGTESELYRTDGSPDGTILFKDIVPGDEGSGPSNFTVVEDLLFFTASTPEEGRELWTSDGTEEGTQLAYRLEPGPGDVDMDNFATVNGVVLFSTSQFEEPDGLWRSDGTIAGTAKLAEIEPDQPPQRLGPAAFFSRGSELWTTDGILAGTGLVIDLGTDISSLLVVGDKIFLAVEGELWVSDGSEGGTEVIAELDFGPGGSENFAAFGNQLVFAATDESNGREPWVSDGTAGGTVLLRDVNPGTSSSSPGSFAAVGSVGVFAAFVEGLGSELWMTDGTQEGTRLVADIRPGEIGSTPSQFATTDNALYFVADDGTHDAELWRANLHAEVVAVDRFVVEGDIGTTPADVDLAVAEASLLPIGIDYTTQDGTATGESDFEPIQGSVEIPPGQLVGSLPVNVLGDLEPESDELFRVRLVGLANATALDDSADVTLLTDDWEMGSCGFPDSIRLHDRTFDDTARFVVCRELRSDSVTVESGGLLELFAGQIIKLGEGFAVVGSGSLRAGLTTDP